VGVIHPGDRHAEILFGLLESVGTAGNLTTDAHLAALAIEHQAELHSTDADFARFPGLRWINPLV
jgi:predicted nucleic acid-binding protein